VRTFWRSGQHAHVGTGVDDDDACWTQLLQQQQHHHGRQDDRRRTTDDRLMLSERHTEQRRRATAQVRWQTTAGLPVALLALQFRGPSWGQRKCGGKDFRSETTCAIGPIIAYYCFLPIIAVLMQGSIFSVNVLLLCGTVYRF